MTVSVPNRPTAWRLTTLVLVLFVALGGCAYFNLFYNAKEAFQEGEKIGEDVDPRDRPTSQQRNQYQVAIRKCRMLLDEYPDSGLVDDALFLMGKSHFRLREWSEAVRSLELMIANFPASEFAEEAIYLLSIAHLSLGDEEAGLRWFAQLRESYPDGDFAAEALYRLGDAWANAGRRKRAAESYEEFIAEFASRPEAARARVALARLYLEDEEPEKALAALEDFDAGDIDSDREKHDLTYSAGTLRVEAQLASGQLENVLEEIDALEKVARTDAEKRKAVLLRGRALLARGEIEAGREVLTTLVEENDLQPEATEARLIAIQYFARTEGPESERLREEIASAREASRLPGDQAGAVREQISLLETYDQLRERYDAGDSTSAAAAFTLGEIVFTDFGRTAEAYDWYQLSYELAPEGPLAPRALYALGWLSGELLDQPERGEQWFAKLQECCPDSPQARARRGEEFLVAKTRTREELERLAGLRPAGEGGFGGDASTDDPRRVPWRSLRNGGPGALVSREAGL